jgi:hypothetical protein
LKEGIAKLMTIKPDMPQQLQIRLTSSVELMRASLDAYLPWIEQTISESCLWMMNRAFVSRCRRHWSSTDSA